ncbi:MAG: amidohydrolase family protein [Armatimonadota bacterium]
MPLAIRAGRLIDGTGAPPRRNALILVEKNRIDVVAGENEASVPAGYDLVDASHSTVLPGLIDCHVHLVASGDPRDGFFGVTELGKSIPTTTLACYKNALRDLEAGWTTVRDAASRYYADVALRDAINRGDIVGPRLWCCGLGITSTAGHMDREKYLAPHLTLPGPSAVADDPTEGRKAVRLNLRNNVDFIKINATLTEHVRRYFGYMAPEMTRETMAAIFEEAHWHGRRVTAHCYGGPGATWAIEEGIDGIEHGFYLSDEQLGRMAERGTVLCPTLSVVGRFREHGDAALPPGDPYLPAWREKAIANAWKTAGRARERGVKIICGTDAAMPFVYHGTNAYELEMLVEAGLTPMEAVVAATGGAAEAIDFTDVGSIASGKFADLVVVDGDPLEDIRILQDLARIPLVIKDGRIVADRRPAGDRPPARVEALAIG